MKWSATIGCATLTCCLAANAFSADGDTSVDIELRIEDGKGDPLDGAEVLCCRGDVDLEIKIPKQHPYTFPVPVGSPVILAIRYDEPNGKRKFVPASIPLAVTRDQPKVYLPLSLVETRSIKKPVQLKAAVGALEQVMSSLTACNSNSHFIGGFQRDIGALEEVMRDTAIAKSAEISSELRDSTRARLNQLAMESRSRLPEVILAGQTLHFVGGLDFETTDKQFAQANVNLASKFNSVLIKNQKWLSLYDQKLFQCSANSSISWADDGDKPALFKLSPETGIIEKQTENSLVKLGMTTPKKYSKLESLGNGSALVLSNEKGDIELALLDEARKAIITRKVLNEVKSYKSAAMSQDKSKIIIVARSGQDDTLFTFDLKSQNTRKIGSFSHNVSGQAIDNSGYIYFSDNLQQKIFAIAPDSSKTKEVDTVEGLLGPIALVDKTIVVPTVKGPIEKREVK